MRRYKLLLLALIIAGTLLGSFHHHDDGHVNENCFICIVQNFFTDADLVEAFVFEGVAFFFCIPLFYKGVYPSNLGLYAYPSRAPPLFS